MNSEYLEITVDKFNIKIKTGCYYNREGLWVKVEHDLARVGVSDFLQLQSGDAAFVNLKEPGVTIKQDEELGSLETIKADVALSSPVSGTIEAVNKQLERKPELVNQDPYGEGWLLVVRLGGFTADVKNLLDAQSYLEVVKAEAEEAMRR
jgi:glycine cleavage system H protein